MATTTTDNNQHSTSRYDLDQVRVTGQHWTIPLSDMERLLGVRPRLTRWIKLKRWVQRWIATH